ncbi:MAG: hypothetical protein WCK05_00355 [Planctomycetota bacterium]
MPPTPGEAAFVLVGGPLLPAGLLPLLRDGFTIGVALGDVPFAPSVVFDGPPPSAVRWALAQGCRPVCLVGADVRGTDGADLLVLLARGNVWLWNYRGQTFERMVRKQRETVTSNQWPCREGLLPGY